MYAPRPKALVTLALAITLAACSSQQPDNSAAQVQVKQQPAPVPVAQPRVLEEIQVTGSRITPASDVSIASTAEAAGMSRQAAQVYWPTPPPAANTENYEDFADNPTQLVRQQPVSTFSIDVDTGSYSNVRRFLHDNMLPPADAVRTEELVNYFSYDYSDVSTEAPFVVATEIAPSPWHAGRHLLQIGIKAVEPEREASRHSNLVFLVDVSGSMNSPDKLELLKTSLKMLSRELTVDDSIAIVVYAGASGVVLDPVSGDQTRKIALALEQLQAGGSTNGAAGIELAYQLAAAHFVEGGINRVLLATDGDFNVGTTDFDALVKLIEEKRKTGIGLTTLGFGTGNYNDHLMEQLADAGNGNYAYIDSINEARKVLVEEMSATLQTVAKDVKVQIEFNPALVSEYRLVGYENRVLRQQDFNNDKVDAGEIGAGHEVTALYEITLASSAAHSMDPPRYATTPAAGTAASPFADELAFLKLRYKMPDSDDSTLLQHPLHLADMKQDWQSTSENYRFAAAVAGFSQLLRDNEALDEFDYDDVLSLASGARGSDDLGYRSEFINLVKTAQALAAD
jgi:Ca-activated chloride channel family protein